MAFFIKAMRKMMHGEMLSFLSIVREVREPRHRLRIHPEDELDHQLPCRKVISPVDQADVGVNVARGNANHDRRDPLPVQMNGLCIGPSALSDRELDGDPCSRRHFLHESYEATI